MIMVLLPGMEGTGLLFQPFIESLPDTITPLVIAYPAEQKMSYVELQIFVTAQLPRQEGFILVAESFSGPIAYQIALQHPTHLKAVIFVASFLSPPGSVALNIARFPPCSWLLGKSIPDFVVRSFFLGATAEQPLIDLFKKAMSQVSAAVLLCRLHEMHDLPTEHVSCFVPALYLQASHDKLVPAKAVAEFKQAMQHLTVKQVEASHFILQVNPQACVEIIENLHLPSIKHCIL